MRTLWLLIAALLAFAGALHAQVAAPVLNPIGVISDAPSNPAALSWDAPSRIAGGLITFELADPTLPVSPFAEGEGPFVQAQWIGETFSAGILVATLSGDVDASVGGGTVDFDATVLQFAAQFGETFSVGIGQEVLEFSVSGNAIPGANGTEEQSLPLAGATVRLAEVFYLGAAFGDETLELSSPGATSQEADRGVIRLGVAYHWRDGESGVHLEYHREEVDEITAPPFNEDEEEADGFTLEVVFANILLSYESITTESSDSFGATGEEESTTIAVGWAPMEGLAIVAGVSEEETRDNAGVVTDTADFTTIGIAWLF